MTWENDYVKMKKKYKDLPNIKWVKENLKVERKEKNSLIEDIRISMIEKIKAVIDGMIEPIILCQGDFSHYFERSCLKKDERNKLFKTYKKIKSLSWKSNELELLYDEKKCIKWIKEFKILWDKELPFLLKIINKLSDGWKSPKKKIKLNYHG